MVVYINNAFSSKMIVEKGLCTSFDFISEEDFIEESHKEGVISTIGHPDTAKMFNLKENRQTVHLNDGDTLFVCELNNSTNTRLPVGITQLEEMPDGFSFRFLKIEVFKKP